MNILLIPVHSLHNIAVLGLAAWPTFVKEKRSTFQVHKLKTTVNTYFPQLHFSNLD